VTLFALAFLTGFPCPSRAQDKSTSNIAITNPRSRETPPSARVGVGYLVIVNKGTVPDRLVALSSPAAERTELHRTTVEGTVTRMLPVTLPLEIAPGQAITLEPGTLHLMLVDIKAPLRPGATIPVQLSFESAGQLMAELVVEPLRGARGPAGHSGQH